MISAPPTQLIDVSKLAVDQAVAFLIEHATTVGASDLFLVSNEQHLAVLIRHWGIVRPISVLQPEQGKRALAHIRALASMDLTERRRPADARWIYRKPNGDVVDLRINTIPTMYGEDFAIRLLSRNNKLYSLERLGMNKEQLQQYQQMIAGPSGLVLITGPTGSGKTATLYASLMHLNDGQRKINTIEDPIEYAIEGLRQSQVNPAIDLGFAELLRSVLRQSPDVVMIGEIRDAITAQTAVHAANSGILVFATLHAPSAPAAIQSMRSLGVHSHFLGASLRGIVSQRLVRLLDPENRVAVDVGDAPEMFEEVRPWLAPDEGKVLYATKLVEANQMTGYIGRAGVFEVLPASKAIRNLVSDGAPVKDIRAQMRADKIPEFRQVAMLKVARGETTTEELFRVIPSEHMLMDEA